MIKIQTKLDFKHLHLQYVNSVIESILLYSVFS